MTVYNFTPTQTRSPWVPGETFTISAYFELTAGLADGDTIVWTDAIVPSGISAVAALVTTTQLDSNASPTGTFSFGDSDAYSDADAYATARYILAGKMGTDVAGQMVVTHSNVPPQQESVGSPAHTEQVNGIGYTYTNSENAPTNEGGGYLDLVYTVTVVPATAASTGTVWAYFTYYCVGTA